MAAALKRPQPLRGLPPETLALTAVAFLVALGFGVLAPAIPLFARHFGVSLAAADAVISAFAGARLLAAPFAGRLIDRFGERIMLSCGIGIVAVSSLLAGFAGSYWQLLALRGAGGVGSVMFSVSAASLLIRVTPAHLRGRAEGLFTGGFLLGGITGPALGFVASISLRAPFFLYTATLVLAGAVGFVALRHSTLAARSAGSQAASRMALSHALRDRAYVSALLSNVAEAWAVVGTRSALVPLFVTGGLHLNPLWTYVAFFLVSAVSGALLLPIGHYSDRHGRRPVMVSGLLIGALGLAVLPILSNIGGLVLSMILLGVAGAALSVSSGAMLADIVSGSGGTVVAVYQMGGDVGSFVGPLCAGALADAHGYGASFGLAAVISAAPAALVARSRETRQPPD